METWKQNAWISWNVNETNIGMHSDEKVLLTWPGLLQDFWNLEIAFKSKEICTEKSQFLTLECSFHFTKDIQSGMLVLLVGKQMDTDLVQQDLVGQRPKRMTSIAKKKNDY